METEGKKYSCCLCRTCSIQNVLGFGSKGCIQKVGTMKNDLLSTTEELCGWTKGASQHNETWWWNPEVEVVIEKKKCLKKWQKSGLDVDKAAYKCAKQIARRGVAGSIELKRQEVVSELNSVVNSVGKRTNHTPYKT